jgi:hypothetical protein
MADLEARGVPTVGVATTEFIEGAAAGAKSLGIDPAIVFVTHPVQDRTDDELKKLADDHLEPILALLVKRRPGPLGSAQEYRSRTREILAEISCACESSSIWDLVNTY